MKCSNPDCSKDAKIKYCSRTCASLINNRLHPKRILEGKCKTCEISISSSAKYCSSCWKNLCEEKHKNSISEESLIKRKNQTKQAVLSYRQRSKQKAIVYLGGSCKICSYNKCVAALEFHHLDPLKKDFGIGDSGNTRSWEKTKIELDKCILVCANCHREIHAGLIIL